MTSLHVAAQKNSKNIVKLLLLKGANKKAIDIIYETKILLLF